MQMSKPLIKQLQHNHISALVDGFDKSGWTEKPASTFEQYLEEQNENKRICLVAFVKDKFAGYITLKWQSQYSHFAKDKVPEISDLNVLPTFRKNGIGSTLIEQCEELAATKSNLVGIGVGLYTDYGSAQKLYIKLGYTPDGYGITYDYQPVVPGNKYPMDDDLTLWLTKRLFKK
jgi:ribosomal protein S18 acetylase RimI-like enzyme